VQQGTVVKNPWFPNRMEFGVPLNAGDKRVARAADRFDDAIAVASGLNLHPRGEILDCLMVDAVDEQGLSWRVQAAQPSPRLDLYRVKIMLVGALVEVHGQWPALGRQILVQRASEGDIQNLDAPTDAENRLARINESLNQSYLIAITYCVTSPFMMQSRFAI